MSVPMGPIRLLSHVKAWLLFASDQEFEFLEEQDATTTRTADNRPAVELREKGLSILRTNNEA